MADGTWNPGGDPYVVFKKVDNGDGTYSLAVSGTMALSSASLSALETTELGATTLAALETTELGATTLTALEDVNAEMYRKAATATATIANGQTESDAV